MAGSVTIGSAAPDNRGAKARHLEGIDSVRALAALSVVLAHIVGPELPRLLKHTPLAATILPDLAQYLFTGHPAVIAFFVVSGFCIHYPYVCKPLPVLPFWVARWVRIMVPALVAMILARLAKLNDYNFKDGYILWSIVCELFYYMFYPLFLWISRWVSWRLQFYLALLLSFVLVINLGTNQYGAAHIYGPLLNWIVALPSWLAGCVLAESIHKETERESSYGRVRHIVLWRLLVAFVASFLFWATMNTRFGFYLTMNAFALLVYLWIRAEVLLHRSGKTSLERVGQWSYSVYLLHMPLLLIGARLLRPVWSGTFVLWCLPLVLYGSYWLYRWVELPAHLYARRMFKSVNPRGLYVGRASEPGSVMPNGGQV